MTAATLDVEVRDALAGVYDPCSVACSTPLNIIDMGLVVGWRFDEDERVLHLDLRVTSPGCFLIQNIIEAVERRFEEVEAVDHVLVQVVGAGVWTPDMMSGEGRATLRRRRREAVARLGLMPQQWRGSPGC